MPSVLNAMVVTKIMCAPRLTEATDRLEVLTTVTCPSQQGLTLIHFSAQVEPCLTHKNTLNTLNTP